jgi:O-antigen ligase
LVLLVGAAPLPPSWRSEPTRWLAFCVLSTLAATCTLRRVKVGFPPHWRVRHSATLAAVCFLAWVIVSASLSRLPHLAGYEAVRHASGVLLFLSVAYGFSRANVAAYGRLVVLALAAAALGGIGAYGRSGGEALGGAFADEQLLAAALAVLLPVGLAMGCRDPSPHWRTLAALAVCGALAALLLTRNRTAWVAVGLAFTLQLALEWRLRAASNSPGRIPAAAGVILVGALAIFALGTGRAPETMGRIATLGETSQDATLLWRREMWAAAGRMVRERPVLGWGVGSFAVQQARFRPGGRTQREILTEGASLSESAHNTYLHVAAELGLPGLACYVAVPALLAYTLLGRLRRSRAGLVASLSAASVGAVAAQAACGYASPAWDFVQGSAFQWLVLGGAALLGRTGSRSDNEGRVGR